jgi:alpha-N-arabinofuranosidase
MPYTNPVIPGFYPDPSICRVGQDYYLVTSTFEYFPGIPIFHSRDLVHWRQIGHVLTRPSQLPLDHAGSSGGIYAPTIRHHAGQFYVVGTNISVGKQFYVSTSDPAGEWSEPTWLAHTGIDPSLFFDDDGKVYFTWTVDNGIYQYELDIERGERIGEPRLIWRGTGGRYPEAPHLYKIAALYYLMIAEGGTEYGHMETIARSNSAWGPFSPCPRNPILTHRNRGGYSIQGTGHADLIETPEQDWWMVFLGFRQSDQWATFHHLGRETYLAPVTWDADHWPVVNQHGSVEIHMDTEPLPAHPWEPLPEMDSFDEPTLQLCWNFLRNPYPQTWSLTERPGWLRLQGSAVTLNDLDSPAFVGRRQTQFNCRAAAALDFAASRDGDEAGLVVLMNDSHHYEIGVTLHNGTRGVFVRRRIGDLTAIVAQESIPAGLITLHLEADANQYTFSYECEDGITHVLATGATRYLSSEVAGGFTGVYLGLYATGNGSQSTVPADFDWFLYETL